MADETTLVLLKPDAVQRGLVGTLLNRLERSGLKVVGLKLLQIDDELASRHYAEHVGKPFYAGLKQFISSSPIVALALQGREAVAQTRSLIGATDPTKADPGTIRGDFGIDLGRNLVHGSANLEDARREVGLFFTKRELLDYPRDYDRWITES